MPRNRYQLLNSFLHFNDNAEQVARGQPGFDPLFKVRPLIDISMPTYQQHFHPRAQLSVDESLAPSGQARVTRGDKKWEFVPGPWRQICILCPRRRSTRSQLAWHEAGTHDHYERQQPNRGEANKESPSWRRTLCHEEAIYCRSLQQVHGWRRQTGPEGNYRFPNQKVKAYRVIYNYLVEVALVNAHISHRIANPTSKL